MLFTGAIFYVFRKSAESLGKGRKGGLFGALMESTAKIVNSKDIGVRFK